MNEEMKFPKTFEEFIKQYSFFDKQQIYTNGSELIQVFRIKQWEEHKEKENQELKLELSGYRQAILEDKDMLGLKEESEELKKQLTTYKILHRDCKVDNLKNISKIEEMENQQKKFIKYLEDEIKKATTNPYTKLSEYGMNRIHIYKEILSKYKEIIGDDK